MLCTILHREYIWSEGWLIHNLLTTPACRYLLIFQFNIIPFSSNFEIIVVFHYTHTYIHTYTIIMLKINSRGERVYGAIWCPLDLQHSINFVSVVKFRTVCSSISENVLTVFLRVLIVCNVMMYPLVGGLKRYNNNIIYTLLLYYYIVCSHI
jgi:hypothetical protein